MSTYIHFTEEEKQRAASVDLEEFLRCRGEKLLSSGRVPESLTTQKAFICRLL